jgi:DIS3-like exonuclease 2
MLPRPLCEVACSLNENVERLAFSCVWKMNTNGTLTGGSAGSSQDVWYGRTVIKSCARLDYSTAQNIIEKRIANGEGESEMDDTLWPKSRRPTGGHTIDEVAADVRLMHKVAMARRKLRFSNGALALHGVKLTFQLDDDGETPLRCAPYPIKDSNRLVEEYMLLANYLVAQRLITHAGDRAVLRRHPDPLPLGLEKVVDVAKAMFDFHVDASSSASLHASLCRLETVCNDQVILQCVTQMLTTPMQNADYFAAGAFERELWRHFALNIPYYTHFTSPIRRYADVLVHRLLQATIDGQEAVESFPQDSAELNEICEHCNEKRLASKMAQERCDVVFLALYLRRNPVRSELGVVMSMGNKALTVYVPTLGISAMMFLDEHKEWLEYESHGEDHDRRLVLTRKEGSCKPSTGPKWSRLEIKIFSKLMVSCLYKDKPRVDVKLELQGPAA